MYFMLSADPGVDSNVSRLSDSLLRFLPESYHTRGLVLSCCYSSISSSGMKVSVELWAGLADRIAGRIGALAKESSGTPKAEAAVRRCPPASHDAAAFGVTDRVLTQGPAPSKGGCAMLVEFLASIGPVELDHPGLRAVGPGRIVRPRLVYLLVDRHRRIVTGTLSFQLLARMSANSVPVKPRLASSWLLSLRYCIDRQAGLSRRRGGYGQPLPQPSRTAVIDSAPSPRWKNPSRTARVACGFRDSLVAGGGARSSGLGTRHPRDGMQPTESCRQSLSESFQTARS